MLLESSTGLILDDLMPLLICYSKIHNEVDFRIFEGSENMTDRQILEPVQGNLSVLLNHLHYDLDFVRDDGQKAFMHIGQNIG